MEKTTPCIAGGGLLAAIAAVLRLVGSAIRFGPFSVSLVLIPIVLGAALYGWGMGCWLGLVFGAVVLLSGDAGLFLAADPGGAIVTVLSKGIACGAAAPLCRREAVYDEDLLLRGLWKLYTADCPSADKP